ncbi:hypothetical protein ACIA8I_04605 [Streptomyces rishiriensis]|uniref:hypothetical protein n=2 Tax=Streptomyces rishiriensis TaxID=68264 RepID=UPI00379EB14C
MSDTAHAEEELLRRGLHELAETDCAADASLRPDLLMARGRRTLRRRRMATLTASLALLGVVGAGGVYGGVFDAGRGEGDDIAAETSGKTRVVAILKGLLPAEKVSGEREQPPSSHPYRGGSLVFDDGKGAAAISITLDRLDSPFWELSSVAGCTGGSWGPRGTCTEKTLADGSSLLLTQAYEAPYRDQDPKEWSARLITPDGSMLTVREWNAPRPKGAAASRETPPLTQRQLTDVVTAKQWQDTLDSLPRRGGGQTAPGAPNGDEVREAFEGLAPEGLRVTRSIDDRAPTSYTKIDVDDGHGKALIEVSIDRFGHNDSGRMHYSAQDGPYLWGEKGIMRRFVTAVRPDGLRVTVTAYNSNGRLTAPTRATPPLTLKQLRAIAGGDVWDKL